jgi:small-conductance mechanosensitive channel
MDEQLQTPKYARKTAIPDQLATRPKILQKPYSAIRVLTLTDSSVPIVIRPCTTVAEFNATPSDLTQAALESLRTHGFTIPFPQREVCLPGPV